MNILTLLPLISAICVFVLGFFVLLINPKSRINLTFSLYSLSVFIWLFSTFMMFLNEDNSSIAIFWDKIVYSAVVFIPAFLYHFYLALTRQRNNFFLYLAYTLSLFFLALSQTNLFTDGIYYYSWGAHTKASLFHHIFLIYFMSYATAWIILVYRYYKHLKNTSHKHHIKYFLISFFIFYILGPTAFLPAYGIDVYPFAYLIGLIFTITISYSIIKHNIFNVKVIATEIAAFAIFVLFLTRFVLSGSKNDFIMNGVFFIVAVLLGFFLIKSVKKESVVNEEMKRKNKELFRLNVRLVELDKHKDDFVSIAAHQLRTPAGVIRNYVGMMKSGLYGDVPEKLNDPVGRIYENAVLLAETVSSILDISRIESGKTKIEFKKNNIEELLKTIIDGLLSNAEKKGLSLHLEVKEGINYEIVFDHEKIDHMLSNLIDNAIKYTEKGGVTVKLYGNEFFILVDVADTGRGMSKKFIETQLYQKFAREEEVVNNVSGNGLGMYFVKEVVELHKGKISVVSEWGKGSTFTVAIPTKLVEQSAEVKVDMKVEKKNVASST